MALAYVPENYFTDEARLKWSIFCKAMGVRVRRLRARKALTPAQAAKGCSMSPRMYKDIEEPNKDPVQYGKIFNLPNVYKIALFYGVSIQYLLGEEHIIGRNNTMMHQFYTLPEEMQKQISELIKTMSDTFIENNKITVKISPRKGK